MNLELSDKVVIVTGGAKGIGEAISRSFASEGAVSCIFDRDARAAIQLADELRRGGGRADAFVCDLTDESALRNAVDSVIVRYGGVDCVVNNAGVNDGVGLRSTVAQFRESLEKNMVHCFVMVQSCLDSLIERSGVVVNIGSKCAATGQGGTSGYVAAKGALDALTREWALDLAQYGIRVNSVIPAEVLTPMYQEWISTRSDPAAALRRIEQSIPLDRRMTSPREIADAVVFIASPRSSHTTGQIVYVDGGYTHLDRACTNG